MLAIRKTIAVISPTKRPPIPSATRVMEGSGIAEDAEVRNGQGPKRMIAVNSFFKSLQPAYNALKCRSFF